MTPVCRRPTTSGKKTERKAGRRGRVDGWATDSVGSFAPISALFGAADWLESWRAFNQWDARPPLSFSSVKEWSGWREWTRRRPPIRPAEDFPTDTNVRKRKPSVRRTDGRRISHSLVSFRFDFRPAARGFAAEGSGRRISASDVFCSQQKNSLVGGRGRGLHRRQLVESHIAGGRCCRGGVAGEWRRMAVEKRAHRRRRSGRRLGHSRAEGRRSSIRTRTAARSPSRSSLSIIREQRSGRPTGRSFGGQSAFFVEERIGDRTERFRHDERSGELPV